MKFFATPNFLIATLRIVTTGRSEMTLFLILYFHVATECKFTFSNSIYQQIHGCTMNGLLFVTFSDIYIYIYIEREREREIN